MKTEVKSDNELIAEFMGITWDLFTRKEVDFQGDWNFLMPVVEKIENDLLFQVEIHTSRWLFLNYRNKMALTLGELLLECDLKMVRQQKKIKKLKAKVASLEEMLQQRQQESEL